MDPLEAIDWSATLPADMPDRAAIESTIHQIFAHITTERKRILARRSEAERRWLEYVPEQGERVRVLESCNADEERLNGRERQVLAFYKRNFERQRGDAVGHETTAAMQVGRVRVLQRFF